MDRPTPALETRGWAAYVYALLSTRSALRGLMPAAKKARAVGFNHIALEVGDIDEALSF
jgi:hypothetical protein